MVSCVIELKIFPASNGQTFWGKSRSFIIACVQFLLINHHFHPTVKGVVSLLTFFLLQVTFTKWRNYRNWCYHFVLWYILRSFCCVNSFVKWIWRPLFAATLFILKLINTHALFLLIEMAFMFLLLLLPLKGN